jgi:hypothetical protein
MERAVARLFTASNPGTSLESLARAVVQSERPCQPAQAGVTVRQHSRRRLVDFMRDRGGQLPHHAHPVDVREIGFELAQPLALFLGLQSFGDVAAMFSRNRRPPYQNTVVWTSTGNTEPSIRRCQCLSDTASPAAARSTAAFTHARSDSRWKESGVFPISSCRVRPRLLQACRFTSTTIPCSRRRWSARSAPRPTPGREAGRSARHTASAQ